MPASETEATTGTTKANRSSEEGAAPMPDVKQEFEQLEVAVSSLLEGFVDVRGRALLAEENHRKLAEALRATDVDEMAPTELQARLEELAEENGRLRATMEEAQSRADRIRRRLMLMEDELADG